MAKLIGKNPPAETVYTLELTEKELGTLLVGFAFSSFADRQRTATDLAIPSLTDPGDQYRLYKFLKQEVLGVKPY